MLSLGSIVNLFADLRWRISFLSSFNGRQVFLDKVPTIDVQDYACSIGAGAFFCGDWLYINYKEVSAIYFAAKQWATSWSCHHIVIHSDNMAAAVIINKGTCKNKVVMAFLRDLFGFQLFAILELQLSTFQGIKILLRMLFHVCMMDFI